MEATTQEQGGAVKKVHPLAVRITHWVNVFAMLIMIASGWRIYNASPLFDFKFPRDLTLGGAGWAARCNGTLRQCGYWSSTDLFMSPTVSSRAILGQISCR